jgi:hypothetical protein
MRILRYIIFNANNSICISILKKIRNARSRRDLEKTTRKRWIQTYAASHKLPVKTGQMSEQLKLPLSSENKFQVS